MSRSEETQQRFADRVVGILASKFETSEDEVAERIAFFFGQHAAFSGFRGLGYEYDGSLGAKRAVRNMRKELFSMFIDKAAYTGDISRGRHFAALEVDDGVRLLNGILKQLVWVYVIDNPRMATHQFGQREVVRFLLDKHVQVALHGSEGGLSIFPQGRKDTILSLREGGDKMGLLRFAADHVSNMTDAYATMMFHRLSGQAAGPLNVYI
ncbi:hypothetical protein [Streptacidiphilus jeojiensis]